MLLYIATTSRTASVVLVHERDAQVIAEEKIDAPCMWAPPEEEAMVPASPHEESSHAPSTAGSLPQDDPPEPPEEVTPVTLAKVQKPVYIISIVLRAMQECYTMQQKLLYTLLIASRKLYHYFQGQPIRVVTD
jgi:hypothetical protein